EKAHAEPREGRGDSDGVAASQRRRWNAVNGAGWKFDPVFLGADVGRKLDLVAPAANLLGKCPRREEMPARASGSEQDQAATQAGCSLMSPCSGSDSAGTLTLTRPAIGRLRVRPSAKPMVNAIASSDEPP